MADKKTYAIGTMKIKNANDVLVKFHPITHIDCVYDYYTNESLTSIMETLESDLEEAKTSGGVKIVNGMPKTEAFYDNVSNETLCVVFPVDAWNLTIKSQRYTTSNGAPSDGYYTAVPFNLYGAESNAAIEVDWGDGTSSTLTPSDYTASNFSASMHKYVGDTASTMHVVSVSSPDFSKTYLMSCSTSLYYDDTQRIVNRAFRNTLISVDTPIPRVAGIVVYDDSTGNAFDRETNSMNSLFFGCTEVESVCSGLFDLNPNVTNFDYIFCQWQSQNTKMKTLPNGLFKYNTGAAGFYRGFYCMCFESLPEDLFKYTNENLMLTSAFSGIHTWRPILHVPSNLFWYNKNITSFSSMSMQCEEFDLRIGSPIVSYASNMFAITDTLNPLKRIVRVPSGTTTHSTFASLVDELKITVVGE